MPPRKPRSPAASPADPTASPADPTASPATSPPEATSPAAAASEPAASEPAAAASKPAVPSPPPADDAPPGAPPAEAAPKKPRAPRKKKGEAVSGEVTAGVSADGQPAAPGDGSPTPLAEGAGTSGTGVSSEGQPAPQGATGTEVSSEGQAAASGEAASPAAPAKKPRAPRKKKGEAAAEGTTAEGTTAGGTTTGGQEPGAAADGQPAAEGQEAGTAGVPEEGQVAARPAKSKAKKKGAKSPAEMGIAELVDHIMGDERVVYFGVKHFSPACALHVTELILQLNPVGVLVEGPEDATPLIPYIVDDDTRTPFTIFSSYVDKDNQFKLNGTLSPAENIPARYRGWWPFTEYAPEYAALRAGKLVGAKLAFIDAPLLATIPYHHVPRRESAQTVDDRHLAESRYFEALRQRQRRRSFEEFWAANFEVNCQALSTEEFQRTVLTFAHCARLSGGGAESGALEADGTLLREGLMRHHIDAFLKENPVGKVVVVTGAFHSVALPFTKGQKVKTRADKNLETLLTGHSFQALANLYHLNRLPAYGQAVWDAMKARSPEPFNAAAIQLLIEVMRKARDAKEGVSTADSVGAYHVARNLAVLRRNRQTTVEDVLDAVHMTYIKGDRRVRGGEVERAAQEVLIGTRLGRVTSAAGQAPLIRDYYALCKTHKLDITGTKKDVRCDVGKQEDHRYKSAFLHQCNFLTVPMFSNLDGGGYNYRTQTYTEQTHFKGPDIATGKGMDLITETWGVQWQVQVDDRLLELSDRGAGVGQAASSMLREQALKARGSAPETTTLLLKSVQMMLGDVFGELLSSVEDAIVQDSLFHNLTAALHNFVVLTSYRDSIPPQLTPRVMTTVATLFNKSCLLLPALRNTQPEEVKQALEDLQTLVRITLTFEATRLDRQLLTEKIAELVADQDGSSAIRGAGFGILFSFGAVGERVVTRELNGYLLGSSERVLQAGAFLDGLFLSSKSIFMSSPRLLRAIGGVLRQLDWATFKMLLPDLRRAFTQFIPTEIDRISVRVSEEVGLNEAPSRDEPVPEALARVSGAADAKVSKVLADWC
jgi:hypothetical protein